MIDWKEFLVGENRFNMAYFNTEINIIRNTELQKHFLGEVARITKELKPFKGKINFDRDYWIHLNGQLSVYKELAGVETKK